MSSTIGSERIGKAILRLTDIAGSLQEDWVNLALQLEFEKDEVMKIKSGSISVEEQAFVMLQLWVQKNGKNATGTMLENALQQLGREDIFLNYRKIVESVSDDVERAAANVNLHGTEVLTEELGTAVQSVELVDVLYNKQDIIEETEVHDGISLKLKNERSEAVMIAERDGVENDRPEAVMIVERDAVENERPEAVMIIEQDGGLVLSDAVLPWDVDSKSNIARLITYIPGMDITCENAGHTQENRDESVEDSSSTCSSHFTEDHVTTECLDDASPTDDCHQTSDVSDAVTRRHSVSPDAPQARKSFPCPDCKKVFDRKAMLSQHLLTHTTDRSFICPLCDRTFKRKSSLVLHVQLHTDEKSFLCCRCGNRFNTKLKLTYHMRTHTNDSTLGKKNDRRSSDEKPVVCPVCNKRLAQKDYLETHIRGHTGDRPFPCPQCDKKFIRKRDLDIHMRIHTGERPYGCPNCDKRFKQIGDLNVHIRGHTEERERFSCPKCDTQFFFKNSLKRHMRVHAGSEPFLCLFCDKKFNQNHDLKIHVRMHTGERPFSCPECDSSFASRNGLLRHQRIHTGEKPFPCTQCDAGFTTKNGLLRHRQTHTD